MRPSAAQRSRLRPPLAARAWPERPRPGRRAQGQSSGGAGELPTLSIGMRLSSGLFMLTVHSFQCLFISIATYAKIALNDIDKMIAEDRTHNRNLKKPNILNNKTFCSLQFPRSSAVFWTEGSVKKKSWMVANKAFLVSGTFGTAEQLTSSAAAGTPHAPHAVDCPW